MERLANMTAYVRTIERGAFAAAATAPGISPR